MKKWLARLVVLVIAGQLCICLLAMISSTPTDASPFPQDHITNATPPSADCVTILVDAEEFWPMLKADIQSATDYVYVQSMSFEADHAGLCLANALRAHAGVDRRIIADEYSLFYSSDKFSLSPANWSNDELKSEIAATKQLVRQLRKEGVQFKWVKPVAGSFINFPARNHKKLVVIDDRISYLGGINFCDHNFEWHDMMIRIEHQGIAKMQKVDFLGTWLGQDFAGKVNFGTFQFYFFDGVNNATTFSDIVALLNQAEESIYIESAYLSFPFFDLLRQAKQRGVDVTVISPQQNNKRVMEDYIAWECARSGLELQLYQGKMNHLRALLVDGNVLIAGSGNFDYLNYTLQIENSVMISDATVIAKFKEQVLLPDLRAVAVNVSSISTSVGSTSSVAVSWDSGPLISMSSKSPKVPFVPLDVTWKRSLTVWPANAARL